MALNARPRRRPSALEIAALVLLWAAGAAVISVLVFLNASRATVIAGHDAEVRPTLDGYATLDVGPYLPRFRVDTGQRIGADIDLGATDLDSYSELVQRYAVLASQPEGQIDKLRATLTDLATDSALLGALFGLAAPGTVLLVGRRRWSELAHPWTRRRTAAAVTALVVAGGAFVVIRDRPEPSVAGDQWQPLADAVPELTIPEEAAGIEIEAGLVTSGTRRLVQSAFATYNKSLDFYSDLVAAAPGLTDQLREPQDDEVVGVLVSDRHDNIGMDPVARAVAEAGGATFLMDAGDDTSTGGSWEAFSLESLDQAFEDFGERYGVAGNHDHGDFVFETMSRLGFTMLDGEVVEGPEGIRLLGASDVRSSGLGSWRDESGDISFADQRSLLADFACARDEAGERVSTMLVHDANSGREALERGCVDLVLAGHLHAMIGPTPVVGENGKVGYSFTTGTTGGAAYALALGSKLRRDAMVTLVTYRGGRPVGIQPVRVLTTGDYQVETYRPLNYTSVGQSPEQTDETAPQPSS